ncbi:MAG: hypothetical protein SF066_07135 [Thermoanaerobaculia bacterium]|nr:hypothetical protein [Thermoanaerobaculia bacterium]
MKIQVLGLAGLLLLGGTVPVGADIFIKSDDYTEGEEVIGKHLNDDDYRLMIDALERNGEEFDWGWVKAPGKLTKLKDLGFDPTSYKSVVIPEVKNFAGLTAKDIPATVAEAFGLAAAELGWTVAETGDLELSMALVDIKRDSTFAVVAVVKPFIELEIRLKDTKTGESLLILRHQAHAEKVEDVGLLVADKLVKFLQ